MGSYRHPQVFNPLDLQIIDLVYEAAWAQFEARDPYRDARKDDELQELLRKKVFAVAIPGEVEFDALLDNVLSALPAAPQTSALMGQCLAEDGEPFQGEPICRNI
jgi:hypothetical protein